MTNQLNKQDILELITKLNIDEALKKPIIDFVNTYDGTNQREYLLFMMMLVMLINRYEELNIKAAGYDAFTEESENYENLIAGLKEEYDDLNAGELPKDPPTRATQTNPEE